MKKARRKAKPKRARFYVYRLIDPRDGETFYVGKGSGKRYAAHWGNPVNALVAERIEYLRRAGIHYRHEIVAGCLTEDEAFGLERKLIAATPGLCNISAGRLTGVERARVDVRMALRKLRPIRCVPMESRPMYIQIVKELAREFANPSPRWVEFDYEGRVLEVGY